MRVTNTLLHNNFLFNLGRRRAAQVTLQDQIASGKQFTRPSEDPLRIGRSLTLRTSITLNNRLQENIKQAQTLANLQDDNLGQANDIMQRVRELAVRASNSHLSPQQYDAIAREVEQLTKQMVTLGNFTDGEKFIFGGHQNHLPPFQDRYDIVLDGTELGTMGLNGMAGANTPVVSRIPARGIAAGAFAFPDGALSINGYDIGALNLPDPTRTSADNAQALADRINKSTDVTGVRAVVTTIDGLSGVQLEARDRFGVPTGKEIVVSGTDNGTHTGVYNGQTTRDLVQAAGATMVTPGTDIVAGDLIINGVDIAAVGGTIDLTTGPPTANQAAQRVVDAINAQSRKTLVTATTNTNGRIILSSVGESFTVATAATPGGAAAGFAAGSSTVHAHLSGTPVSAAPLSFGVGSLRINNVEIFTAGTVIDHGSAQANATTLASYINSRSQDTGVRATADAAGNLRFSSLGSVMTSVEYVGDVGRINTEAGVDDRIATNLTGDLAFSGSRAQIQVVGRQDVQAGSLNLAAGAMMINGIDVTAGWVPTPAGHTATQNTQALISHLNSFAAQTGVTVTAADNNPSRLVFSSRGASIDVTSAVGTSPLATTGIDLGKTEAKNSIFQALLNLREALVNAKELPGRVDSISLQNIREVGESLENLANNRSILGAQANRLERSHDRLQALNTNHQALLSENEDTDYHQALTQLAQEELVYQAALGIGARILPPTLMDFMR